jgi:hypothetical protein
VDAYATMAGNVKNGRLTGTARRKAESKPIEFRPDAAQPYDDRILSWNLDQRTVSISPTPTTSSPRRSSLPLYAPRAGLPWKT